MLFGFTQDSADRTVMQFFLNKKLVDLPSGSEPLDYSVPALYTSAQLFFRQFPVRGLSVGSELLALTMVILMTVSVFPAAFPAFIAFALCGAYFTGALIAVFSFRFSSAPAAIVAAKVSVFAHICSAFSTAFMLCLLLHCLFSTSAIRTGCISLSSCFSASHSPLPTHFILHCPFFATAIWTGCISLSTCFSASHCPFFTTAIWTSYISLSSCFSASHCPLLTHFILHCPFFATAICISSIILSCFPARYRYPISASNPVALR